MEDPEVINFFSNISCTTKIFISIILLVFYIVLRYRDRKNNTSSKRLQIDFKNSDTASNDKQDTESKDLY